eukprot:CAMPEP_0197632416 /NCGR_PEP_ID=MMETSP1338-20131121/9177_1 /TAXON_ID=43686 ORGANISM="Pelagodinium beii, Strain RCC1491" /NCGR_SAMPLE_ID=MMETSP1338 /ASSEMBLY_ACC=CAM_ASM_000754 /LENGTH=653 /DNA_ID=CAMNT_0043203981 /DNA_START=54 /DNA_END=2015 /DNA_ORIENTATION=-
MGLGLSSTGATCCVDRSGEIRRPACPLQLCYLDFRKPAEAAQAGGAQARLFRLVPVGCDSSKRQASVAGSGPEWIGKDVSTCYNEADFYNEVLHLRRLQQQDPPLQPVPCKTLPMEPPTPDNASGDGSSLSKDGPWRIFDFMVSYHGLARSCMCSWHADGKEKQRTCDLLVFRSPFEGLARPRMLDLELGPRTLALQARDDNKIASVVLALQEGISVDGFLAPPASIPSESTTLDLRGWSWGDTVQARAKRLPLQKLSLSQALAAFIDLRAPIAEEKVWLSDETVASNRVTAARSWDNFRHRFLCGAEYAELALLALTQQLAELLKACEEVPVPQKWVQTSLALLVEVGVAPPRTGPIHPATWVSSRVKLQVFGWGKSRLSLPHCISSDDMQDNVLPWKIYQHHISRVLWESARLYFHSFCAQAWTKLQIEVFEVCGKSSVLIGSASMQLEKSASDSRSLPLQLEDQPVVGSDGQASKVVLNMTFLPCPEPSNFVGFWQICVQRAENLPRPPTAAGAAAPSGSLVVKIIAVEDTSLGYRTSYARTREVVKTENPMWKEDFEFPVVQVGKISASVMRLLDVLGVRADRPTAEAMAAAAAPNGSLSSYLPPLNYQSESTNNAKEAVRDAAIGQVAFISELQSGWQGHKTGLIAQV